MAAQVRCRDNYVGERVNQLREGYGVYTYENQFFRYEGEWVAGKKHGHGKLVMKDGSYYEGEFKNGEIEGHGYRYYAASKCEYTGQFHVGECHGQGIMKYPGGPEGADVYEGEWNRNKRQGYGVLKGSDNSIYQGQLHDNKRHGEGTQIYSNGDRYDGDWVLDKRQGHGEIRCRDGTIYDGQWGNDLYNGQGSMSHASGVIYEGLWINGRPGVMSAKLAIVPEGPIEVVQGLPFSIEVKTVNGMGKDVEDQGREIQMIAGFKHIVVSEEDIAQHKEMGLFDVIEDLEEKPIPTPFGYDIVTYPLTDVYRPEPEPAPEGIGSRTTTTVSDTAIPEDASEQKEGDAPAAQPEPEAAEPTVVKDPEAPSAAEDRTESPTVTSSEMTGDQAQAGLQEGSLAPPVENKRTEKGIIKYGTLVLPPSPPMYRPFVLMDAEEKSRNIKSRSSTPEPKKVEPVATSSDSSRPTTRKSQKNALLGDDRFARPASKASGRLRKEEIEKGESPAPTPAQPPPSRKKKTQVPEKPMTRPGEYIIKVQDVTTPMFMEYQLEPAYVQIKVLPAPKKKVVRPKEPKPKWDTRSHISSSVARGLGEVADEEMDALLAAAEKA